MSDRYTFRLDGNFFVRVACYKCAEFFDVHAMANSKAIDLCPACEQVEKWMHEAERDAS